MHCQLPSSSWSLWYLARAVLASFFGLLLHAGMFKWTPQNVAFPSLRDGHMLTCLIPNPEGKGGGSVVVSAHPLLNLPQDVFNTSYNSVTT